MQNLTLIYYAESDGAADRSSFSIHVLATYDKDIRVSNDQLRGILKSAGIPFYVFEETFGQGEAADTVNMGQTLFFPFLAKLECIKSQNLCSNESFSSQQIEEGWKRLQEFTDYLNEHVNTVDDLKRLWEQCKVNKKPLVVKSFHNLWQEQIATFKNFFECVMELVKEQNSLMPR